MATNADERDADRIIGHPPVSREMKHTEANADAITGSPGSHPVGTGVGAAAAGAAGAAIGSVVPGVGTVIGGTVGAVVGAVAGGYAGKAVAERINPTDEHAYWREQYKNRDYYKPNYDFDADYVPAYSAAVDVYNQDPARSFDLSQDQLRQSWEVRRGASRLDWADARDAAQDVYARDRKPLASEDDEPVI